MSRVPPRGLVVADNVFDRLNCFPVKGGILAHVGGFAGGGAGLLVARSITAPVEIQTYSSDEEHENGGKELWSVRMQPPVVAVIDSLLCHDHGSGAGILELQPYRCARDDYSDGVLLMRTVENGAFKAILPGFPEPSLDHLDSAS